MLFSCLILQTFRFPLIFTCHLLFDGILRSLSLFSCSDEERLFCIKSCKLKSTSIRQQVVEGPVVPGRAHTVLNVTLLDAHSACAACLGSMDCKLEIPGHNASYNFLVSVGGVGGGPTSRNS